MRALYRPALPAAAASLVIAAVGVYEMRGAQPEAGYAPRVGDAVIYPWGDTERSWEVARLGRLNGVPYLTLRSGDAEVLADLDDVRPTSPLFGF